MLYSYFYHLLETGQLNQKIQFFPPKFYEVEIDPCMRVCKQGECGFNAIKRFSDKVDEDTYVLLTKATVNHLQNGLGEKIIYRIKGYSIIYWFKEDYFVCLAPLNDRDAFLISATNVRDLKVNHFPYDIATIKATTRLPSKAIIIDRCD